MVRVSGSLSRLRFELRRWPFFPLSSMVIDSFDQLAGILQPSFHTIIIGKNNCVWLVPCAIINKANNAYLQYVVWTWIGFKIEKSGGLVLLVLDS